VAAGALLLVAAAVAAILIAGTGDPGSDTPSKRQAQATATPRATSTPQRAEATRTATPSPTPTAEATREPTPSPTATPAPTQQPAQNQQGGSGGGGGVQGTDPVALQGQAFRLNNAGQADRALPFAQKAVELCKGSSQVNPCAYALFEYARSLRMTGDAQGAIAALRERQSRFPDDQPAAVKAELKLARAAAGK
jgi:hypothetical protein